MTKFIQVVTGVYQTKDKRTLHALYALGEDGKVYKHLLDEGWVPMGGKSGVVSQPRRFKNDSVSDDVPF